MSTLKIVTMCATKPLQLHLLLLITKGGCFHWTTAAVISLSRSGEYISGSSTHSVSIKRYEQTSYVGYCCFAFKAAN